MKRLWHGKKSLAGFIFIGIMNVFLPLTAAEEEKTDLGELVVTGETLFVPTMEANETVYTGTEITKEGIESRRNEGEDQRI